MKKNVKKEYFKKRLKTIQKLAADAKDVFQTLKTCVVRAIRKDSGRAEWKKKT